MKKILLILKENWEDPVWSKVIAAGIISISGIILTSAYSIIVSVYYSIPFDEVLNGILKALNKGLEVKIWLLSLFIIFYLFLTLPPFLELVRNIFTKVRNRKNQNGVTTNQESPSAPRHTTTFFHQRMASAFPGIRDVTWFENPKEAINRLEELLKEPIKFEPKYADFESRPIWWFRGGSALYIEEFKRIGFFGRKVLMNSDRLKIKRIAAYQGASYYKDFVYVEVEGEKQSGIYNFDEEDIKRRIDLRGYSWEEYGVIENWIGWKTPITREEYDDGARVVNGKVKDAMDAKLRTRYLSDYNFIIAAKGSPYNSLKFNKYSESYFNRILKNEIKPDEFFEFLKGFKKPDVLS